jgi:plasmid stability protein
MKNITVSVDDDLYHRARIKAAEQRSTVSALVRRYLTDLVDEETPFQELARAQNELISKIRTAHPGFSARRRLTRDQVHDRDALR